MIYNVVTIDITQEEWNLKLKTESNKWLMIQYKGFDYLYKSCDKKLSKAEFDDEDKTVLDTLENEKLDIEVQLIDVEDEIAKRNE